MADFASCYFCASPDNVQEFAVVPERFDPDADEQRTVVLCESCHGKLGRVIEPLADRLDAARGTEPGRDVAGAAGQPEPGPGDASGEQADTPGGAPAEVDEGGITVEPPSDVAADERAAGSSTNADDGGDGITVDQGAGEEADDGTDRTDEAAGEADSDAADRASPPRGYRKAMRLLENREFPLDRYEVEGLIAGAYDLTREEVDDIIEAAVESGRFVEEGGKLKRA